MPTIEEVPEDDKSTISTGAYSRQELMATLRQLAERLRLPDDLLPSFMEEDKPEDLLRTYHDVALNTVRQIRSSTSYPEWQALSLEEQGEIILAIVRLHGSDPWTSDIIVQTIDDITSTIDESAMAIYLLSNPLRSLFTPSPHPMLNTTTSRALPLPAGGKDAQTDFHDTSTQLFKTISGWGCYNVLRWSCNHLSSCTIEAKIGVILPPTLVLMDDWEPLWRGRGIKVLESWYKKFPVIMMKRMGIDKLFLESLIHTLSLHSNPPLKGVLGTTLVLVELTREGEQKANVLTEIMEKYLIHGWMYVTSNRENRDVLIDLSRGLVELCKVLETGIVRWLKTIIPSLLEPLQYTSSPPVLQHHLANLSALLTLLQTVRSTNRVPRWRGQVINVLCRLWLQLAEREYDPISELEAYETALKIRTTARKIFKELDRQCSTISIEFRNLLDLNKEAFTDLVPSHA